ncbi:MAG: peptide chain release factor N(5)-glutamine methyltransferase [Elusimicrobia bacterium]|nr:peptide chain release factor N(5)-glutamine methyltransferase [Elusimicrobiota bacterium]
MITGTRTLPVGVAEALAVAQETLEQAGVSNAAMEGKEMVARALGLSPKSIEWERDRRWEPSAQLLLSSLLLRRCSGFPLAYLLGEWDFLDFTLTLTRDVLIPRPETEELFDLVRETGEAPRSVVDVGTGSGGLALAMARYWPEVRVTALDLSPAALAVARWNARRYGLEAKIEFRRSDLLEGIADTPVDRIVANLPYIPTPDLEDLSPEVRKEPRLALDGGPDGLTLIRRLVPQSVRALRPGGRLYLEVGIGQAAVVARLLSGTGFSNVAIFQDFAGKDRFVRGER